MTPRIPRLVAAILVLSVLPSAELPAAHASEPAQRISNVVAGRVLVKFDEAAAPRIAASIARGRPLETGLASLDALNRTMGVRDVKPALAFVGDLDADGSVGMRRWYAVEVPIASDVHWLARRFAMDDHVEAAHVSFPYTQLTVPNDPLHPEHWGHHNTAQLPVWDESCPPGCAHEMSHCGPDVGVVGFDTGIEDAWSEAQGYGDTSVVIAIIDSGFDTDHPDIHYVQGRDTWDEDDDPDISGNGHGTACAGVAAAIADNGLGVAGVAGGCSIMPLRALFPVDFAEAVAFAVTHGADVLSISIGYIGVTEYPIVDDALTAAAAAGMVIVVASGNSNDSLMWVPATHPDVITVGAADPCGNRKTPASCDGESWWGATYGGTEADSAGTIDLIAPTILPTTDILGVDGEADGDYCLYFSGTSCAAPYVAGMAALLKSAHPAWTPAQIRQRLVETAIDIVNAESGVGWDRYTGYGMVSGDALIDGNVGVPGAGVTPSLSLSAHPNPFRGSVAFAFSLPPGANGRLRVYDAGGRLVRDLQAPAGAGQGTVTWDGRTDGGALVSEGAYFVNLTAAGRTLTRKVVRIEHD